MISRRGALSAAAAALAAPFMPARAADEELIDVYFGCGCERSKTPRAPRFHCAFPPTRLVLILTIAGFWHVQHEFVEAERRILGRKDSELTSLVGYAGGKAGAKNGKVCYHNALQVSDYGSLGHAEVVRLRIPARSVPQFAAEYAKLFDENGNRPDQFGDRGLEYRNVVGLPGGTKSPLAQAVVKASIANGDKLDFANGKGDDPDARAVAFIMDTNTFPFYQAEPYHQFHDGFKFDENYPNSYNGLANALLKQGRIVDLGCPNGMIGIGIAGL